MQEFKGLIKTSQGEKVTQFREPAMKYNSFSYFFLLLKETYTHTYIYK